MASGCSVVSDRTRRLRHLPKHECVPGHRHSDVAASAVVEEFERTEYAGEPAHAGERVCERARHYTHHVRDRPRLPHRLHPELATIPAKGPACRSSDDGNLSGNKGNSFASRVSTEHVSDRSCESDGLCVPDIKWKLHSSCRSDSVTAAAS